MLNLRDDHYDPEYDNDMPGWDQLPDLNIQEHEKVQVPLRPVPEISDTLIDELSILPKKPKYGPDRGQA